MNPNFPKSTEASGATMPWYADLVADLGNLVGGKNFGLRLSFLALLTAGGCAGGAMNQPPEGPQDINPRELQMLLIQNGLSTGIQPDGSKINDIKMVASGSLMDILGKEEELKKQGKTVKRLRFGGSFVLVVVEQETSKGQEKGRKKELSYAHTKVSITINNADKHTEPPPPMPPDYPSLPSPLPGLPGEEGPDDMMRDYYLKDIKNTLEQWLNKSKDRFYQIYLEAKKRDPSLKGRLLVECPLKSDGRILVPILPDRAQGMKKTLSNAKMEERIALIIQGWVISNPAGLHATIIFNLDFH